jgi:hypothetical protein
MIIVVVVHLNNNMMMVAAVVVLVPSPVIIKDSEYYPFRALLFSLHLFFASDASAWAGIVILYCVDKFI